MMGFLLTFSLYVTSVFLVIIPVFGLSYTGSDESPIYIITVIGTNAITIIYIVWQEILHHNRAKGAVWPYFIFLPVVIAYISEYAIGNIQEPETKRNLTFFFANALTGVFVGTYCYRYDKFYLIVRNLEPLAILCSAGLLVSLPTMYVADKISSTIGGGGGHQVISYTAALCFCVFFTSLKTNDSRFRYKWLKTKAFQILAQFLLIANAIICILGGGRGGAVLLVVYIVLCLFYFLRKNRVRTMFAIIVGGFLFYYLSTNISLWGIDIMFQQGFERAFAFVDSSGIDMSETSNRDIIYKEANKLIESRPVLGYGVFNQYDLSEKYTGEPYWHNLFYEILLQGGIIYLIFWGVLYIKLIKKAHKLITLGDENYYLIAVCAYPFIMLMFSGTYLLTPLYWFSVIYILGKRMPATKIHSEKNSSNVVGEQMSNAQ